MPQGACYVSIRGRSTRGLSVAVAIGCCRAMMGIIRVFPALPEAWQDANFKLHALGAFVDTATRKTGKVRPLLVQSLKGGTCRLENPWPQDQLSVRELASRRLLRVKANAEIAEFESEAGSVYLIFHKGQAETEPDAPPPRHGANQAPKKWQGNRIGMERLFSSRSCRLCGNRKA